MEALTTRDPRDRLPSKPQKFTRTHRSCVRPTGQPWVQEYPTIRDHSESGTGPTVALAPVPTAGSLTGKRTAGSAPARGTGDREVTDLGAAEGFRVGDGGAVRRAVGAAAALVAFVV